MYLAVVFFVNLCIYLFECLIPSTPWHENPGNKTQCVRQTCTLYLSTGRKIAPNTGANATKFFTLPTKS